MIELDLERLWLGEPIALSPRSHSMTVLCGTGRSATATVCSGTSLWIPLRGRLHLDTGEATIELAAGELLLWSEGRIKTMGGSRSGWIALAGDGGAWKSILADVLPPLIAIGSVLYPCRIDCPKHLRDRLVSLARHLRPTHHPVSAEQLRALVFSLWQLQRPLDALAFRCTGHTPLHKRQNLLRLLRVRQRILRNPHKHFELEEMAAIASYSTRHFSQVFRRVFGESPIKYAWRVRAEHARRATGPGL